MNHWASSTTLDAGIANEVSVGHPWAIPLPPGSVFQWANVAPVLLRDMDRRDQYGFAGVARTVLPL
jgi:hypothetical protein